MYRTVKTLLVILACNFLVAEACLFWHVKKSPPSHHHRPPAHHPPPRPPPPPPVRPTKIIACPPSQDLTSNRGETTRNIFWNAPQITDGSPPYNVVRTGKASGSEFECNGQPSEVCYYAEGRGGRSATCCFNVQCSIIECSEIGEIDGGVVDCTNGNAFGSVCTFQCDDGFILEGPPVSVCEESGISDPAVEWTNDKPTCQHVIQPILVEGTCPDDFVVDAGGPTAVVEWTNPTYQDRTTNDEVPVRCSHESGQTYGITVYPIVCEPDITTNFEYEICEFTVTVQHAACPPLNPPRYGSLALHKTPFAEIAFQQCKEGRDVPKVDIPVGYTGEFHCSYGTEWQPSRAYDCTGKK
ncbi:sushi, von Willebrand factor type A, EGF and pentraxin domain-containing protein 1-like [Apostichopus japonicus]|uniref:sushi, von Willebrand factor type A, EGF and pentraxin domain-containing protein 1-like n=1 Tax=Stichopus japonicus TaxID=307972 RepID=UPI003AB8B84B